MVTVLMVMGDGLLGVLSCCDGLLVYDVILYYPITLTYLSGLAAYTKKFIIQEIMKKMKLYRV